MQTASSSGTRTRDSNGRYCLRERPRTLKPPVCGAAYVKGKIVKQPRMSIRCKEEGCDVVKGPYYSIGNALAAMRQHLQMAHGIYAREKTLSHQVKFVEEQAQYSSEWVDLHNT